VTEQRYKSRALTQLTGVSAELLRAWERRFGLLDPERTEGGHRLYTEDDLAVLGYIRSQLDAGRAIGGLAAEGRAALLAAARETATGATQRWPAVANRTLPAGFPQCLPSLDRATIDGLPCGVVQVDAAGRVLLYNDTESCFSTYPEADVLGRDFFADVAPCCNNPLLRGRFQAGVAAGTFDFTVAYTFTYKLAPTNVLIRVLREPESGTYWVVVQPG